MCAKENERERETGNCQTHNTPTRKNRPGERTTENKSETKTISACAVGRTSPNQLTIFKGFDYMGCFFLVSFISVCSVRQ